MQRLICAATNLVEGGDGVRFEIDTPDGRIPAFAVRYQGRVQAWRNQCAHVSVELDWNPGKLFDDSGLYLICATHGALYHPDTGRCAGGPCRGGSLLRVEVEERNGNLYLQNP